VRVGVSVKVTTLFREETAEIDHSSAHLPAFIDQDVNDTTDVLPAIAADLLTDHTLNVLRERRLPSVLGSRGSARWRRGLLRLLGQGAPTGQDTREYGSGYEITAHEGPPRVSAERESAASVPILHAEAIAADGEGGSEAALKSFEGTPSIMSLR
jgi:hypothetical protein